MIKNNVLIDQAMAELKEAYFKLGNAKILLTGLKWKMDDELEMGKIDRLVNSVEDQRDDIRNLGKKLLNIDV